MENGTTPLTPQRQAHKVAVGDHLKLQHAKRLGCKFGLQSDPFNRYNDSSTEQRVPEEYLQSINQNQNQNIQLDP